MQIGGLYVFYVVKLIEEQKLMPVLYSPRTISRTDRPPPSAPQMHTQFIQINWNNVDRSGVSLPRDVKRPLALRHDNIKVSAVYAVKWYLCVWNVDK